jgi:endonuclease/exonuclease/phosphatase family metal-dependent hydrolase
VRPASILALAAFCLVCLSAFRCSSPLSPAPSREVSIVAYNVKSLFDAKDDGPEFREFSVAKGKWDDARYRIRLGRVAEAVLAALPDGSRPRGCLPGPDLLCLEEIENASVLEALRTGPLAKARYRYAAIANAEGGPFSVCALSRLPILSSACHSVASVGSRAGRDLLELELDAGGAHLRVFACHWKSKSEGGEATEGGRREAAALLRSLVSARVAEDPGAEVVVCGDFNESPDEYLRVKRRYATAFMPVGEVATTSISPNATLGLSPNTSSLALPDRLLVASREAEAKPLASTGELVLYSPWAESGGYSYSFRGSRERLDGFLLSPALLDESGLSYKRFAAVEASFLVDEEGAPIAWPGSGTSGYSDHLPILLVLELRRAG